MANSQCNDRDQNIAAVSAELHGDKRYQRFYDKNADELSGFPGIWSYCAEAADLFTQAEKLVEPGSYEYLEAIMDYVDLILKADNLPSNDALLELARRAIKDASYQPTNQKARK
jgi:hypothetical protein